jgi:heat shock protein HslJ
MNSRSLSGRLVALLGSALLVLALAGCAGAVGTGDGSGNSSTGGGSTSGSGTAQSITGSWQLTSGTDAQGAMTLGTAAVTFTINGASSGGRGGCNAFGAKTTGSTTGAITIVVGIHTDMACVDPDIMSTEGRYFAALDKVTNAALDNGTLTLTGGGDTLVFSKATK